VERSEKNLGSARSGLRIDSGGVVTQAIRMFTPVGGCIRLIETSLTIALSSSIFKLRRR